MASSRRRDTRIPSWLVDFSSSPSEASLSSHQHLPPLRSRHTRSAMATFTPSAIELGLFSIPELRPTHTLDAASEALDAGDAEQLRPSTLPRLSIPFFASPRPLLSRVEVQFDSGIVDLVGGSNTSSSYSLPGQVVITLPQLSPRSDGACREIRDVSVVIEGKSEYADHFGRYTPMRVYASTLPLVPQGRPVLVPEHLADRSGVTVALPFDLRVPGWLPPSHLSDLASTSYGVVATAELRWTSTGPQAKRKRFASPGIERSVSPFTPFTVRRHRMPAAASPRATIREKYFTLQPTKHGDSPLECIVAIPEWIDIHGEEHSLHVQVRIRASQDAGLQSGSGGDIDVEGGTEDLADGDTEVEAMDVESTVSESVTSEASSLDKTRGGPWTHLVELSMEVEEIQRFTCQPSSSFHAAFPVPAQQPRGSSFRLLGPRFEPLARPPIGDSYPSTSAIYGKRACLLSEEGVPRNFCFENAGLPVGRKWRRVNVVLPLPAPGAPGSRYRPWADMEGPFVRMKHILKTSLVCRNPDGHETIVQLSTPIRFATHPHTMPVPNSWAPPPYIHTFHENGDQRDCDPLPLYSSAPPPDMPPLDAFLEPAREPDAATDSTMDVEEELYAAAGREETPQVELSGESSRPGHGRSASVDSNSTLGLGGPNDAAPKLVIQAIARMSTEEPVRASS